jgi:hypothetical protein
VYAVEQNFENNHFQKTTFYVEFYSDDENEPIRVSAVKSGSLWFSRNYSQKFTNRLDKPNVTCSSYYLFGGLKSNLLSFCSLAPKYVMHTSVFCSNWRLKNFDIFKSEKVKKRGRIFSIWAWRFFWRNWPNLCSWCFHTSSN